MTPEPIFKKKILICCGSGGVGKTTLSAAIALEAAARGKNAIVLTIDPARRLATAMGIDSLTNEPKEIVLPGVAGRLFAMMLDTKRTFDHLIERYAASNEAREAILKNRLYRHLSGMIAGSQEYMAMERLYELYQEGGYDFLVLDTPPTRHALDFLDAPRKMVNLTGNSLLKWLLKPGLFASRAGNKILSVFDRLAGFSFLHELSEMVTLIGNLLGGFHDRAQSVSELLRENVVGFLLIASPSSVSIQDALYFHEKIREYRLPFLGFVINRVHESPHETFPEDPDLSEPLRKKVARLIEDCDQLALRDKRAIALLKKMGGKNAFYLPIPLLETDIHDLEGLRRINSLLWQSSCFRGA